MHPAEYPQQRMLWWADSERSSTQCDETDQYSGEARLIYALSGDDVASESAGQSPPGREARCGAV